MKRFFTSLIAMGALSLGLAGCSRLDMQDQPKYKPERPSDFFADGRSERQPLPGTIARGALEEDVAFYVGTDDHGDDIKDFPIAIDKAVILRGEQRYDIYCAPCHGRIGNGLGMIVRRGFKAPPSYHIDRLRDAPIGHYFNVITNGYGAMLNYAQQLEPRDRWAVIAYIRVLQYSENANINDLPQEARSRVPPLSQPPIAAQANEPLVPRDGDFTDFPAKPATPSGVPGAHGAGAVPGSQPERK
jgi:hypothetical protein